jgi:hypothetical protein
LKRAFLVFALALASCGVVLATASADTGGVSIVIDSGSAVCDPVFAGSPCFGPPNTGLHPGDATTLLVTVNQAAAEGADATTVITWPAGALTFVSNGDASAVCTPTASSVSCTYTDFAHSFKSDSFNFTVGPNAPGSTVTASIQTTVVGVGDASATASFTMASLLPTTQAQCKNNGWKNYPQFKNQGDCVSFVATGGKNKPAGRRIHRHNR